MKKTTLPFLALFLAAALALCGPQPAESLTPDDLNGYLEAASSLKLSDDNLKLADEAAAQDARFMGLFRAKLRIARLLQTAESSGPEGESYALRTQVGPLVAFLCRDGFPTPDKLVENAVERIVKPLELQPVLKELPRYYEAVVGTADWQKKFQKILHRGGYPSLDGGTIFHLAGFPEIGDKPYYTAAMDAELQDGSLFLYEGDASVEGWLYSFWMRRWDDGTMDAAKLAIDWLNKALGQ